MLQPTRWISALWDEPCIALELSLFPQCTPVALAQRFGPHHERYLAVRLTFVLVARFTFKCIFIMFYHLPPPNHLKLAMLAVMIFFTMCVECSTSFKLPKYLGISSLGSIIAPATCDSKTVVTT